MDRLVVLLAVNGVSCSSSDATDKRELSVSVWYPADIVSKQQTPYLPDSEL